MPRLLSAVALLCSGTALSATYNVDIGGALDELFVRKGWYGREGPYPQYGPIWHDTVCRWAQQGAEVQLPLFPRVANRLRMRAEVRGDEAQRMWWFLDGEKVAELAPSGDLLYSAEIPAALIGDAKWGVLRIETMTASPVAGDPRDLRVAVDWIEISADAPSRPFLSEALAESGLERGDVSQDVAPSRWRFRYDPNNAGDTYAPQPFYELTYDDSAFEVVPTSHLPPMRRGDAAWYRASVLVVTKLAEVRRDLRLPGEGVEATGRRDVWVNGARLSSEDPEKQPLIERVRERLGEGLNFLVVKIMQGPLPRPTGPPIVEPPPMRAEWTAEGFMLSLGPLRLTPEFADRAELTVRLLDPAGREVAGATARVRDVGEGRRGCPETWGWEVRAYGEHTLAFEDGRGARHTVPVHFLGLHLFHWGWYIAGGGTTSHGFQPCSNDYLDQLFGRLGDWGRPHHSICWCGGILRPGTGFHRTEGVDYVALHREALAAQTLDFVGMPFAPRNICTDFGESLLRGMRYSLDLYESQLGVRPHRFYSHDATMTPQLPQIMQLCGYDTYCIAENWWGQGRSIPNSRDGYLRNPDGTQVRVLDSWYHGISPVRAALRAVQQGKPAVLCNEEFACLDATVFLQQAHLDELAARGIFLKPVSADEYQTITEEFARELVYEGDDALCYKGWTGGGEREVEIEKLNRLLETRLVGLENLVAFARWLGFDVAQAPIQALWEKSLRLHECHLHWGNGYAPHEQELKDALATTDAEMARVAGLIASKVAAEREGVAVLNPLGFARSGLVRLRAPEGAKSLEAVGRRYALQVDPDDPSAAIAALADLPACGVVHLAFSGRPEGGESATAGINGEACVLSNRRMGVRVSPDGQVDLLGRDGAPWPSCEGMNRLWVAQPRGSQPDEPLSTEAKPLNFAHYVQGVAAGKPRVVVNGPALASVECDLRLPGYPGLAVTMRVSLAAGERQARVRLSLRFDEPTVVAPAGAKDPHEGCYFPGIFVDFPLREEARPVADMAYCLTDGVLTSTNHETFMREPFRNGTFNALSIAAPNTSEYAVLTRGLPDFFVLRRPEGRLGLSLGVGTDGCPYHGDYTHEYALFRPEQGETLAAAYYAAQAYLVEPVAVPLSPQEGSLPSVASLVSADGRGALVSGVQLHEGRLALRVLNLLPEPTTVRLRGLVDVNRADVASSGQVSGGTLALPPWALREVTAHVW